MIIFTVATYGQKRAGGSQRFKPAEGRGSRSAGVCSARPAAVGVGGCGWVPATKTPAEKASGHHINEMARVGRVESSRVEQSSDNRQGAKRDVVGKGKALGNHHHHPPSRSKTQKR